MRNKRIKTEYIIIGIIVVLLAYLILRKGDKIHYELPELESLDKNQITKIEITKKDQILNLEKKEDKWFVGPQKFPADKTGVTKILDSARNLSLSSLVSKSKSYSIYGLDKDKRILVKVYEKDKILREFEIGKSASTYRHTYVKIKSDDNVYHADTNFRTDFEKKVDDLRDKIVLKFDKNEISEIDIKKGEKRLHFIKKVQTVETKPEDKKGEKKGTGKEDIEWIAESGETGNKEAINSILDQLSNLSCDKYIENKSKEDLKDPVYTLALKGNKDYSLSLFGKAEKDNNYPAISSENPYPFFISSYSAENIMKKPEDLLKKK